MTMMQIGCYEYLNNNKHTAQSMFEFINQNYNTNIANEDIFSIILTVCIFNGFEDIQYVLNFLSEKCNRYKYSLISIIYIKKLSFLQQHNKCIYRLKALK